jgi:predicted transposase/invertase (TIGR01784 family)
MQVGAGEAYKRVNRVISIIITDGTLIKYPSYHNRFTLFSEEAHEELTDLIEIHILELNKLPIKDDESQLYDWAKFFSAANEDEIETLTEKNPIIGRACEKLKELSADKNLRIELDIRDKRLLAEYQKLYDAEVNGIEEGKRIGIKEGIKEGEKTGIEKGEKLGIEKGKFAVAKNLIRMGHPIDFVIECTGVTRKELEDLQKQM